MFNTTFRKTFPSIQISKSYFYYIPFYLSITYSNYVLTECCTYQYLKLRILKYIILL